MSGKKCLRGALVALSMLSAGGACAAPLKLIGFGDMSCRAWIASKDDAEQRGQYVAWVRGVLTGHNYANQSRQVSDISSSTVDNYVTRYCVQNPQGSFSDAALRMSDQFSGRNAAITK
ncbi:MAG: hypothetical protein HYU78_07265 [Rhodocyclales bacterium]|nr:hypothetical protein [Rhodocyclales bacterium]